MATDVPAPIYTTEYKPHPSKTMKAAQWLGTKSIDIGVVPRPKITAPKDAIVHITHCTICGSDLHMYVGEMNSAMKKGDIMGHEAIGIVDEVGPEVKNVQVGDHVIILPSSLVASDSTARSRSTPSATGPIQAKKWKAEYCRVPNADLTCIKSPHDISAKKLLGLADVTTTAWHGNELAGVGKGNVVRVWGCRPVGLSIQRLALFRGSPGTGVAAEQ